MTSNSAVPEGTTDPVPLTVPPGEQVLLEVEGRRSALSVLPETAFENLVVVTTHDTPGEIEDAILARDGTLDTVGIVPITSSVHRYDGPVWTTERVSPGDLTGVSIRVSQAVANLDAGRGWLVFDSVSTLMMYADEDRVFRLFDWLVGSVRDEALRGVYTVQSGVVTARTLRMLRGRCDDTVRP